MYTLTFSKRQIIGGMVIILIVIGLIFGAIMVRDARAQDLPDFNFYEEVWEILGTYGMPVCVRGKGFGNSPMNFHQARYSDLGKMRVPFNFNTDSQLVFDDCDHKNEFTLVLKFSCIGDYNHGLEDITEPVFPCPFPNPAP